MKKIILSAVAIATLSITAQARDAQDLYNEINTKTINMWSKDYLTNTDKVCKANYDQQPLFVRQNVSAGSTKGSVEQKFGTLSQTMLKSYSGTGISTTIGWEQVARFYDEFLCTLSTKEKLHMVAFLHARSPSKDGEIGNRELRQRRMLAMYQMYDTTEENKRNSFTQSADFSLIDNFAFVRVATNWDNKEYSRGEDATTDVNFKKFFGAIAKRDLAEAKNILESDSRTLQTWRDIMDYLESGNFPQ